MKITEECINHNVVRTIEVIMSYLPNESEFNERIGLNILGEISGVLDLAAELKKVLKA